MFESGGGFIAGIAHSPTVIPAQAGIPTVLPYNAAVLASHRGIPAYAGMTVAEPQSTYYVIPSVAEESKNLERSQERALTGGWGI